MPSLFSPIGFSVGFAQEVEVAGSRREESKNAAKQGRFSAAIWSHDYPVLAGANGPINGAKQGGLTSTQGEAVDFEEGGIHVN